MGDSIGEDESEEGGLRLNFLSRALDGDWGGSGHGKQFVNHAMDTDTGDATGGVTDSLNGETKPDPAKLARSAIIKQVSVPLYFSPPSICSIQLRSNTCDFSRN